MILLILICVVFSIFLLPIQKGYRNILDTEGELHKYSGYNPELFVKAYNLIELSKENVSDPDISADFLYQGVDTLYDFLYFVPDGDLHIKDVDNIALLGEEMILKESLKSGKRFYPRYLNNKIP